MSSDRFDAIVIGAGPAGTTSAIRLAEAGWRVALVEKRAFPRRKVCGECIAASNLPLLDALGIGTSFDALAGPALQRVSLHVGASESSGPLPALDDARHPWGRALGREHLDTLLLQRASALGAEVWQPCKVARRWREHGEHVCALVAPGGSDAVIRARVLIQAQGSWEPGPDAPDAYDGAAPARALHRAGDLFAFKGNYRGARIAAGVLPVLAFRDGYGGMVVAEHGVATLAFCLRRDALRRQRDARPGVPAAQVALDYVRAQCNGVRQALDGAAPLERWLGAGPLRPGIRGAWRSDHSFAVGNAAGEAHPILGEGISMAFQSAWMLCDLLLAGPHDPRGHDPDAARLQAIGRSYERQWRTAFAPRIRFAAACAHVAMRPEAAAALQALFSRWPVLLTQAARVAGKVRAPVMRAPLQSA